MLILLVFDQSLTDISCLIFDVGCVL